MFDWALQCESTVIRFCYAMELSGYVALQELVKESLMRQTGTVPISKVQFQKRQDKGSCFRIMQKDMKGIQDTIQLINEDNFEDVIQCLNSSSSIYIYGKNSSNFVANWFGQYLKQQREGIHIMESDSDIDKLGGLEENSLLVVFAFGNDIKDEMKIIEVAKSKKVKTVGVSGTAIAPIRSYVDLMFTIGSQNQSPLEITTTLISFLHALLEGMVVKRNPNTIA